MFVLIGQKNNGFNLIRKRKYTRMLFHIFRSWFQAWWFLPYRASRRVSVTPWAMGNTHIENDYDNNASILSRIPSSSTAGCNETVWLSHSRVPSRNLLHDRISPGCHADYHTHLSEQWIMSGARTAENCPLVQPPETVTCVPIPHRWPCPEPSRLEVIQRLLRKKAFLEELCKRRPLM